MDHFIKQEIQLIFYNLYCLKIQVYNDKTQMFWGCLGYERQPMSQETWSNIMRVIFVTDDRYNDRGFVMRYVFKGINIVLYEILCMSSLAIHALKAFIPVYQRLLLCYMGLVARKPVFGVSHKASFKTVSSATETG